MRLRSVLLVLVALFAVTMTPAKAQRATATEARALQEAAQNRTAYTLPPEKLKLAKNLFRARTTLHFTGEGWGILQLLLLLALGIPARLRNIAENLNKEFCWGQCFASLVFLFLMTTSHLRWIFLLRIYGHHTSRSPMASPCTGMGQLGLGS